MKNIVFISLFYLNFSPVIAQIKSGEIFFIMKYGDQNLDFNKSYYSEKLGDSIQFSQLKFYLSNIKLISNTYQMEQKKHHLFDFENIKTHKLIYQSDMKFDSISFNLGIDSLTNIAGVMKDDLDPMQGMYWTWQSGYINVKLEGSSLVCKSRNHKFQYHLGGYSAPFNAIQSVNFKVQNSSMIIVYLDLKNFVEDIDLKSKSEIMSPQLDAVILSKKLVNSFYVINQ